MSSDEGYKNGQRAGAPHLQGQAGRVGALLPGEEKAPGGLTVAFQYLEGAYKKAGERLFIRVHSDGMRGNGF